MKTEYRKSFFRTNKYQKQIIFLPLITSFIFCFILSVLLIYASSSGLADALTKTKIKSIISFLDKWYILIIVYLWAFFFVINTFALVVSGRLVGAFERIIRELYLVVDGKKKTHIMARADDALAHQLLKPVNQLIDRLTYLQNENEEQEKRINFLEEKKL